MTIPRLTIKVNKEVLTQFLEIPTLSTKELEYSSHSLAYEMTHPYKHLQPHTLVLGLLYKMAHTLRVACFLPGLTFLHHDLLLSPCLCEAKSPHSAANPGTRT